MKKYIIITSLAVGVLGYGQINTQSNPNPVINQENPFLDASGYNRAKNNVGKGLYFPTTDLTTWEFKTNSINPGKFKNYFDGMIVYNSASGQTIEDTTKGGKQVKVEPGFYYFKNPNQTFPKGSVENGEWIRLNDSFANDQEWKYNLDNQRIELVRSGEGTFKNYVYYDNTTGQHVNTDTFNDIETTTYDLNEETNIVSEVTEKSKLTDLSKAKNLTFSYSKNIEPLINSKGLTDKTMDAKYLYVSPDESVNNIFVSKNYSRLNYNNTNDYGAIYSYSTRNSLYGRGAVNNALGFFGHIDIGNEQNIKGYTSALMAENAISGSPTIKSLKGITSATYFYSKGANVESSSSGSFSSTMPRQDNSLIKNYYGISSTVSNASQNTGEGNRMIGVRNSVQQAGQTKYPNIYGIFSYTTIAENAMKPDNLYGLYLGDAKGAIEKNYAIYTGLGDIRFGQFKENGAPAERLLAVDADGKLVVGGSSATFASLWANDATNNLVKLKTLADGTTARTDSGDNRNSVTIDNAGIVTAKGYRGYNGAEMFPDYVFENYYKGASTIKANYTFKNLNQVESFVKTNGHLPGYQSAKEVKAQGYVDIMKTQLTNVEKIEELYLHTIAQEKEIKAQKEVLKSKDAKIAELEIRLSKLEQLLNK